MARVAPDIGLILANTLGNAVNSGIDVSNKMKQRELEEKKFAAEQENSKFTKALMAKQAGLTYDSGANTNSQISGLLKPSGDEDLDVINNDQASDLAAETPAKSNNPYDISSYGFKEDPSAALKRQADLAGLQEKIGDKDPTAKKNVSFRNSYRSQLKQSGLNPDLITDDMTASDIKEMLPSLIEGMKGQYGLMRDKNKNSGDGTSAPQVPSNIPAGTDPAMLVPKLVPDNRQKDVFNEIKAAQDTKRMSQSILDSFEQAAQENTAMKTGFGYLRTPGSVLALHQAMQPTFQDLEGTVRQAAMDNTFNNITPAPGDSDHKIGQKRQALMGYLQSKASAPQAKAFGIDLSKFDSTAKSVPSQGGGMLQRQAPNSNAHPQDSEAIQWAKANPNDQRSAAILKVNGM